MQTKTMYRYFLSYTYGADEGQAFTNTEVTLRKPIEAMEQVRVLEQILRDRHCTGNVVILSFTLLER